MKKTLAALVGLFLIFVLAGVSMATPYDYTQNTPFSFYDADGHRTNTWTFYLPGSLNTANLYIHVTDDARWFSCEYADLFAGGKQIWDSKEVDGQLYGPYNIFAQVKDNSLLVKIDLVKNYWGNYGDFGVNYVEVKGDYTASVPEPATMLLLGLGLVGLAGFGRKRFNA